MAILERVKIENFRNVAHRDFLVASMNVIEGKNMSGKTNTLNAIHWGFTGVTMDGSGDNRLNFPINGEERTSVKLFFDSFTFERVCESVNGTPTVTIYIDDTKATSVKIGDANLHAKLGLSDIILTQPKGFNIIRFLLNPLYFEGVAPKDLRKFFYSLADVNFNDIRACQKASVKATLDRYVSNEPYALCDTVANLKKNIKKNIETCKLARGLFPSIEQESLDKEKDLNRNLKILEADEALIEKYALDVSRHINNWYQRALGIKICLLEKGVGDDVYKDVCYPILPKSNLPFDVGSYAERSYIGMRFIQEVCLKWNIKPLPILLDNMESLDKSTTNLVVELGAQYIGAKVI